MNIHVGLDDFDSEKAGCTTHLAFRLIKELITKGYITEEYPRLIRLNPDAPWKTRGNGAIAFKFKCRNDRDKDNAIYIIKRITEQYYFTENIDTNPGVIICINEVPREFKGIYRKALYSLVPLSKVYEILGGYDNVIFWYWGTGRGLIGAAAALGADVYCKDHTFEILVYRPLHIKHRNRRISTEKLILDEPQDTFANIDYETKRVLISPHGLDPVILGIRGENPEAVYEGMKRVNIEEEVEGWIIYVTNQATFENLRKKRICEIAPYTQVIIEGRVKDSPCTIPGGHVLFKVNDGTGEIDVMVYEPSGRLRKFIREIEKGDKLLVGGGVKINNGKLTVNTQIVILKERRISKERTPICPKCLRHMISLGQNKGYECKKCKYRISGQIKSLVTVFKKPKPEILEPPLRSIRHLTRPIQRIGIKNRRREKLYQHWIKY